MIFSDQREDLRRQFLDVWKKADARQPLTALEDLIAGVIREHPEYHELLASGEAALEKEWRPEDGETNPFLHMGLHIAIREQLSIDRPPGVRAAFEQLAQRLGDGHAAEHGAQECLAKTIWEAQRAGLPPDEQRYLAELRNMAMGRSG